MTIMRLFYALPFFILFSSTLFAQKQSRVYKIVPIVYDDFENKWDLRINGMYSDSTSKIIRIRGNDFSDIRCLLLKRNNSDKYKDRIKLIGPPKVSSDDEFVYYSYPMCISKNDGPCVLKFEIKKQSDIIYIDLIFKKHNYGFMFEVKNLLVNKKYT